MGVVTLCNAYLGLMVLVLIAYTVRHAIFAINRMVRRSRHSLQDVFDSDPPFVTVLIPMHNEARVATHILDALLVADYPADRLQVIAIDDHSDDSTGSIIDSYAARDKRIETLHRRSGGRGKPVALNEAIGYARGEILVVFDADYIPGRGFIRELVGAFVDPEIGAVMGRVVPLNCGTNLLTRLLDLERAAGYQVDQQARHNLGLIPQYGGTAGAFRRRAYDAVGGFRAHALSEDTDLTFRLVLAGWRVAYSNRCECYEEVPETWYMRMRQIRRWAIGHTQCFVEFAPKMLTARGLKPLARLDGLMLLAVYLIAPMLVLALCASLFLLFAGDLAAVSAFAFIFAIIAFNSLGNFASFFQIGTAVVLDGHGDRIRLLPLNILNFAFSSVVVTQALVSHAFRRRNGRATEWQKTERFRT